MKKVQRLILSLVVLLAFGCGKDDDGGTPSDPNDIAIQKCKLASHQVSVHGSVSGENYIYNNQGRIEKIVQTSKGVVFPDYYKIVSYDLSGKADTVKRAENGKIYSFNKYLYYPNGLLRQISFYKDYQYRNPAVFRLADTDAYEYDSQGRVAKILNTRIEENGDTSFVHQQTFTYPTSSTARSESIFLPVATSRPVIVYEYTFDNQINPRFGLHQVFNGNHIFKHNVLTVKSYDIGGVVLHSNVYQYNASGYPVKETNSSTYNNTVAVTDYTYTCQ